MDPLPFVMGIALIALIAGWFCRRAWESHRKPRDMNGLCCCGHHQVYHYGGRGLCFERGCSCQIFIPEPLPPVVHPIAPAKPKKQKKPDFAWVKDLYEDE